MLREIEHEYIVATRNLTPSFTQMRKDVSVEELKRLKEELTEDMKYHQKNRKLCLFLLSPYGDPYFSRKMAESIAERAEKSFLKYNTAYGSNLNYVLHFFQAALSAPSTNG